MGNTLVQALVLTQNSYYELIFCLRVGSFRMDGCPNIPMSQIANHSEPSSLYCSSPCTLHFPLSCTLTICPKVYLLGQVVRVHQLGAVGGTSDRTISCHIMMHTHWLWTSFMLWRRVVHVVLGQLNCVIISTTFTFKLRFNAI